MESGVGEDILIEAKDTPQSFLVCFAPSESLNYKMNIPQYGISLETKDWDRKPLRKLFTEVINQVRSGVIFS